MNILVMDAQGGGLGRQIITAVKKEFPKVEITAVGSNALATSNMLKTGVEHAATGENAVIVACRKADVIIGPIGIVIADSMYGEITPDMAVAVGQSSAIKLLIPMNQCDNVIIGMENVSMNFMVSSVIEELEEILKSDCK